MVAWFRTGGFASAFLMLAAVFATPAAAQGQATAAIAAQGGWTLPSRPLPQAVEPSKVIAAPKQGTAPAANPFASLPAKAGSVAPAISYPRSNRSLDEMVMSYVNFGDQDAQQECLAKAVYFEARSEPLEGQLAVADVVLNRAASGVYPPTICEVVTQPWQFSFVNATRSIPEPNRNSRAWHTALAIADIARKNLAEVVPPNVLWYHANYVSPSWGRRLNRVAQIGLHIFYS